MPNKLYILTCAYFARDVKTALDLDDGVEDIELISFSPDCGQPALSSDNISALIPGYTDSSELLIMGNICIANEIKNTNETANKKSPYRYLYLEQCFHLICPPKIIDQALNNGDYLISPGWLSGWNKNVRRWGFNETDTKCFFQESVKQLHLIDTAVSPNSKQQLKALSEQVEIPARTTLVGLDYLRLLLEKEIASWREKNRQKAHLAQQKLVTNYAMSFDLISHLSNSSSEPEIIDGILELFLMLFAPDDLVYIPVSDGTKETPISHDSLPEPTKDIINQIPSFSDGYSLCDSGTGFWLLFKHQQHEFGYLKVNKIAMLQYLKSYLNQSLNLTHVCALLIENSRIQKKLVDTAHLAGKAELAIEVLHNIGNLINSVGVSANYIQELLKESACSKIPAVIQLMEQHEDNLGEFIDNDPRGQNILAFLSLHNKENLRQKDTSIAESRRLINIIDQIKGIIRSQQAHSRDSVLLEKISCENLIAEVIVLYKQKLEQHEINLQKDIAKTGVLMLAKYKLLQILGNLLSNAIDALIDIKDRPRKLQIKSFIEEERLHIQVIDNGIGIEDEEKVQIFQYGYTSKDNHSGYGLHSASNLVTEIGGKLSLDSEGSNKGTCFLVDIPLNRK